MVLAVGTTMDTQMVVNAVKQAVWSAGSASAASDSQHG